MGKPASAGGPPPADKLASAQARMKTFSLANFTLGTIATFLAVAMRVLQ